jgi:hypothetical protein
MSNFSNTYLISARQDSILVNYQGLAKQPTVVLITRPSWRIGIYSHSFLASFPPPVCPERCPSGPKLMWFLTSGYHGPRLMSSAIPTYTNRITATAWYITKMNPMDWSGRPIVPWGSTPPAAEALAVCNHHTPWVVSPDRHPRPESAHPELG